MKQKTEFILICVVSVLFMVALTVAVIFTVQKRENMKSASDATETISKTITEDVTSIMTESEIITRNDVITFNKETMDYEIEAENKQVKVEGLTDKEQKFLESDVDTLENELNTFITGYGYQSAESLILEESEYDSGTQTYILTFKININLHKIPYVLVKYQKQSHTFEMEMW